MSCSLLSAGSSARYLPPCSWMCLCRGDKEERRARFCLSWRFTASFYSFLIFADCHVRRRFYTHVCPEILVLVFFRPVIFFLPDLLSCLFLLLSVSWSRKEFPGYREYRSSPQVLRGYVQFNVCSKPKTLWWGKDRWKTETRLAKAALGLEQLLKKTH